MRRSKAPSMKNRFKRHCPESANNNSSGEAYGSDPEDDHYAWGSKDKPEESEKEYLGTQKRIFNIVWRDVSSKKHKTWKGDGTLEVNVYTMKAVAKDETGKYLGCSTKFQVCELQEDHQMVVGGKEIEIQNEIKDEDEIHELRRMQVKNRNWGAEEYMKPETKDEEKKKTKAGLRYKPLLVLNSLNVVKEEREEEGCKDEETKTNIRQTDEDNEPCASNALSYQYSSNSRTIRTVPSKAKLGKVFINNSNFALKKHSALTNKFISKSFMCFLKPSELQQYIFQQIRDFYTTNKTTVNIDSLDLPCVLRQICNHPSFIKHTSSSNPLIQHLMPLLPHWSEMGPFDSAKLEFVKYFMHNSMRNSGQNIIIVAKSINALNMIQGLCDFMRLSCFRLNSQQTEGDRKSILEKLSKIEEETSTKIFLINDLNNLKDVPYALSGKQIIVFENVSFYLKEMENFTLWKNQTVYYLITSFSIEEFMILPSFQQRLSESVNYDELFNLLDIDDTMCYVHTKIKCNCFENGVSVNNSDDDSKFFMSWQHLAHPFDEEFLKESALEDCSSNLLDVFYKNTSS